MNWAKLWREDWNDYDGVVARDIFGLDTPDGVEALIGDWTLARLGAPARITELQMSVGAAVGLALDDGRELFLKAWPAHRARRTLQAQLRVQAAMAGDGYPAPRLLGGLESLGPSSAVLMEFARPGEVADARRQDVRDLIARGLADFIRRAARFAEEPGLTPIEWPLEGPVWPRPHTAGFDFEESRRGAEWIDDIARQAQTRLRRAEGPLVVGHHDWSAKNLRVAAGQIAMVYDWDSVFLDRETFAVGATLAHYAVSWDVETTIPTPEEMAAFLAVYEEARGRAFGAAELEEIAAAVTYTRAYVARCEHGAMAPDAENADWTRSSRAWLRRHGGCEADMLRASHPYAGR